MNAFDSLTMDEMMAVDGGKWSWKGFAQYTITTAVGGCACGYAAGTVTLPVVGTVTGAVGGAILGGIGGAAAYLACGWW